MSAQFDASCVDVWTAPFQRGHRPLWRGRRSGPFSPCCIGSFQRGVPASSMVGDTGRGHRVEGITPSSGILMTVFCDRSVSSTFAPRSPSSLPPPRRPFPSLFLFHLFVTGEIFNPPCRSPLPRLTRSLFHSPARIFQWWLLSLSSPSKTKHSCEDRTEGRRATKRKRP